MKRFISLTALATILSTGALLPMSSCVNDYYQEQPTPDSESANVIITVKASKAGSRAEWGNDEYGGNDVELTINTLTMALYDTDNKFVGNVSDLIMLQKDDDGTRRYLGKLPVKSDNTDLIEKGKEYKLMLFANCNPTETDLANPYAITFGRPTPPTHEIPMWGVISPVTFTLNKQVAQEIGSIDLLRAMAKVAVRLSPELRAQGYSLTGPYIDDANLTGYLLPNGWSTVGATADIDPGNAIHEFKVTEHQTVTLTEFTEDGYWRAYMPEISSTEGSRPVISLRVQKDGTEVGHFNLQFGDYDATTGRFIPGSYRDVVRNHIYRYNITGVGTDLNVALNVDPWIDNNTEEWDYSNTVGVNDSERLEWTNGTYGSIIDGAARLIVGNDIQQPAECTFRISSPVGATWTAYLIPANDDTTREDFTFVDADGNDLAEADRPQGVITKDGPMETLRIRPTKAAGNVTREIILHVEVRLGDNDVITANLLGDKYGAGNNEFTLVQNQQ